MKKDERRSGVKKGVSGVGEWGERRRAGRKPPIHFSMINFYSFLKSG